MSEGGRFITGNAPQLTPLPSHYHTELYNQAQSRIYETGTQVQRVFGLTYRQNFPVNLITKTPAEMAQTQLHTLKDVLLH